MLLYVGLGMKSRFYILKENIYYHIVFDALVGELQGRTMFKSKVTF